MKNKKKTNILIVLLIIGQILSFSVIGYLLYQNHKNNDLWDLQLKIDLLQPTSPNSSIPDNSDYLNKSSYRKL